MMSELPLDAPPGDVAAAAHDASRGHVVYLTDHGERLAVIVPAELGRNWSGRHPMSLPNCSKTLPTPPLAVPARALRPGNRLFRGSRSRPKRACERCSIRSSSVMMPARHSIGQTRPSGDRPDVSLTGERKIHAPDRPLSSWVIRARGEYERVPGAS